MNPTGQPSGGQKLRRQVAALAVAAATALMLAPALTHETTPLAPVAQIR